MGKLVDSLGVNVRIGVFDNEKVPPASFYADSVLVSDLESALEKLPVVYGRVDSTWWAPKKVKEDTHTARLLCIEEIDKVIDKEELTDEEKKFVNDMADIARAFNKITDFLKDKL